MACRDKDNATSITGFGTKERSQSKGCETPAVNEHSETQVRNMWGNYYTNLPMLNTKPHGVP